MKAQLQSSQNESIDDLKHKSVLAVIFKQDYE